MTRRLRVDFNHAWDDVVHALMLTERRVAIAICVRAMMRW
jgi:hypothetical protein